MPSQDYEEFIAALNAHGVRYLVIGAHAVAFHARPRATKDLDILLDPTAENARKALAALREFFGGADLGYTIEDLIDPQWAEGQRQMINSPIKLSIAATSKRVDIASVVALTFFNNVQLPRKSRLDLAMGWRGSELGGTGPALLVGKKTYDFGFGNPVGLSRMAYLGRGFYKEQVPLRAIGVFPTWDRLVFAVSKECAIKSIDDIRKQKYPLRVSTRRKGKLQTTLYVIEEILKAYGLSLADIQRWGGKVMEAASPSSPDRMNAIHSGEANAVFDEGIKSWGPLALDSGMEFLPIDEAVLRKMEKIGFPRAMLTRRHYAKMERDIKTVDFSGWTFFCHQELPAEIAYAMAKAVDLCHEQIPVDHFDKRSMTMTEFCRGGEAGQLNIPLHAGAKAYFREKGYL